MEMSDYFFKPKPPMLGFGFAALTVIWLFWKKKRK
jgi:LPXTG-motif cell wall-anchored protein